MIDPGDTLIEIVDEDDRVVDLVTRREMRTRNLRHRSVGIAVLDAEGRVLIHRRADSKDVWPGRWDLAVGGVVEGSLIREIGRAGYEDDDVRTIVRMYVARDDGPFVFADGEVVEAFFVTIDELRERITRHLFVPDSVAMMWPLLTALGEEGAPPTT